MLSPRGGVLALANIVTLIHDKIVELQKAHPSWQKTTPDFKKHFETYYE